MTIYMIESNHGGRGEYGRDLDTELEPDYGYFTSKEAVEEKVRELNAPAYALVGSRITAENQRKRMAYERDVEARTQAHKEWEVLRNAGIEKPEPRMPTVPKVTAVPSYDEWLGTMSGWDDHHHWFTYIEIGAA